jgi:hypothetical protein
VEVIDVAYSCPHCGATYATDEGCQQRFDACLVKEGEHPAYYAVHHLLVPCYMLQHDAYSHEGWLATRGLLARFVRHGLTPADARRQYRTQLGSGQRTWSITRGPRFAPVAAVAWTRTIADVRLDSAELYRADVERWAGAVLADTDELVGALRAAAAATPDQHDRRPRGSRRG